MEIDKFYSEVGKVAEKINQTFFTAEISKGPKGEIYKGYITGLGFREGIKPDEVIKSFTSFPDKNKTTYGRATTMECR